jgi:hypothetical protein
VCVGVPPSSASFGKFEEICTPVTVAVKRWCDGQHNCHTTPKR